MMTLAKQLGMAVLLLAGHLVAADNLPSVTEDGLHRVPDTKVRAAYAKPGADLGEYDKIALLEVYVAFRKNWQRDHNRDAIGLEGRVSDQQSRGRSHHPALGQIVERSPGRGEIGHYQQVVTCQLRIRRSQL